MKTEYLLSIIPSGSHIGVNIVIGVTFLGLCILTEKLIKMREIKQIKQIGYWLKHSESQKK